MSFTGEHLPLPPSSHLPPSPPQVNNVAELLLVRGLAQVVRHRSDEERSGVRQH